MVTTTSISSIKNGTFQNIRERRRKLRKVLERASNTGQWMIKPIDA